MAANGAFRRRLVGTIGPFGDALAGGFPRLPDEQAHSPGLALPESGGGPVLVPLNVLRCMSLVLSIIESAGAVKGFAR